MDELKRADINVRDWEYEFRQRDRHPILMADFWSRSLINNLRQEAKLSVGFDSGYIFTSSDCGYVNIKEKRRLLEAIKSEIGKNDDYLRYIYETTLKRIDEWDKFADEVSSLVQSNPDKKALAEFWKSYDLNLKILIPWFHIPWYVTEENMITDKVKEGLERHRQFIDASGGITEVLTALCFSAREAIFQQEQRAFFDLVGIALKNDNFEKDPVFLSKAQKYLADFGWVGTYFLLPREVMKSEELIRKVKKALSENALEDYEKGIKARKEISELAEKLFQGLSGDEELVKFINWARDFGWLLTFSVEQAIKSSAKFISFYKIVSRTIDVQYEDWANLTSEEILKMLEGGQVVSPAEIKNRKKGFIFMIEKGNRKLTSGDAGRELVEWFEKEVGTKDLEGVEEFKGFPANKGIVRGKVRLALTPADSAMLKIGEILVCAMTSPDYLSAMKRAAAYITDEGGVLSHAAIIAREFNKPCLVGTKIATKVLKDGDLVEVDANRGVVKILKRAE